MGTLESRTVALKEIEGIFFALNSIEWAHVRRPFV